MIHTLGFHQNLTDEEKVKIKPTTINLGLWSASTDQSQFRLDTFIILLQKLLRGFPIL